MINPFCPNGISSLKIIYNLAKKEFGDSIKTPNSFSSIKKDITNALRKMNPKEREENKLDTLVGIEHIKQNDFGNFMTLRFAYWGMLIAIAVAIMGNIQIYEYFNMSKRLFGNIVMYILCIILITMSRTIHIQHDQLEYLNFKLLCFNDIGMK